MRCAAIRSLQKGSAAVARDHDSFEYHFHDTVAGGDWLCEQDVVDYFVHHCPTEMTQLEQWGCPWSRRPDGSVNVRRFGGMKIERTGLPPTKPASTCCIPSSRPPFSFPKFSALTNISSLTCWSMTGRPAAGGDEYDGRHRCRSALTPWCWLPAAPGASTATTPTAASSPVTGWGWP
ncbi:FAD-binding protein [Klebsiella pneumoniae subsp. pneumoniae]|uniref:FAD-binding protein n=1 Tax=Klebsiella pneumoniae subsp. pneumoniae TaxID=72407 RepID=A0A7S9HFJ6_KLEPN|nr:FAD-binding protein [Klebsiella pneumoniae subsp. pneumoniae]